jgi:hypothetical protein
MAKKKSRKKKARTAAQKAATAKLVAMNKGKKTGKKKARKKSKKKRAKKTSAGGWRQHSVGTKRKVVHHAPYRPGSRYKPSLGEQFAGETSRARFHGPMTPSQALEAANREIARLSRRGGSRKKASSKKHAKSGVVTAASILKAAQTQRGVAYVCAGKRYTGCGGGKKGAHVVGHLR